MRERSSGRGKLQLRCRPRNSRPARGLRKLKQAIVPRGRRLGGCNLRGGMKGKRLLRSAILAAPATQSSRTARDLAKILHPARQPRLAVSFDDLLDGDGDLLHQVLAQVGGFVQARQLECLKRAFGTCREVVKHGLRRLHGRLRERAGTKHNITQ